MNNHTVERSPSEVIGLHRGNEDQEAHEQFERDFDAWLQCIEESIEATRESERITAEDLAIIVY